MASKEKYYKLGKGSFLWDPAQPKNKDLVPGKIVSLEKTKKVSEALVNGGLVEVSEEEAKEYFAAQKAKTAAAASTASKDDSKELAALKKQLAEQEAKNAEAEKALKAYHAENQELKKAAETPAK